MDLINNQDLSVDVLYDSLVNYNFFKNKKDMLRELFAYTEMELTKDIVIQYTELLENITQQIDKSRIKVEQKKAIKQIFTLLTTLMAKNHSAEAILMETNNMLTESQNLCQQQDEELIHVKSELHKKEDELQKERNEHNEIRKKYNEKTKEPKIEPAKPFTPSSGANLSISLIDPNRPISPEEITKIFITNKEKLKENQEKFQRLSLKDKNGNTISNNVSRAYGKTNPNNMTNINQKPKK